MTKMWQIVKKNKHTATNKALKAHNYYAQCPGNDMRMHWDMGSIDFPENYLNNSSSLNFCSNLGRFVNGRSFRSVTFQE